MEGYKIGMLGVIIAYLAMMLIIGFVCSKKNNTAGDFYLGGRKLGPLVTAMSAEASDMSAYLLMGLPGLAYLCGTAEAFWTALGLALGTYINWLVVAKRLRRYSAKIDAITIPDFFAKRFGGSKAIVGIAALFIVVFFVPYTASGFKACGTLFSTLFGADYTTTMIISAVIIVAYTALGGFLAASLTDFVQSIAMTIALLIVVFFGISMVGGFGKVIDTVNQPNFLSLTAQLGIDADGALDGSVKDFGFLPIVSTLAWGLGYFGMPHILLRFMAVEKEEHLKRSRRVASVWVVLSMGITILIGITGLAMSKTGILGETFKASSSAETIVSTIAQFMSSKYGFLAIIAGGIIISGILACTMSTADSQLLAASSSVSENIVKSVLGIKIDQKKTMLVARLTVLAIAVVAIFLALDPSSSVFRIVSFAWAGFGAVFGPLMLCSLFWKRTTKYGAVAGMLVGGTTVFIWKFGIAPAGGAWGIYELLPAFILALITIIVTSLLTPAPEKEVVKTFEEI